MNQRRNHLNRAFMRAVIHAIILTALFSAACVPISGLPNTGQGSTTKTPGSATAEVPATGVNTPSVTVNDQEYDGNSVVVADVVSNGPGWMAIHNQVNGAVGPVIGMTHLNDGDNKNVVVKIDPNQATPEMYAMLHTDQGQVNVYEFPGLDIPVTVGGHMITPNFKATRKTDSLSITPSVRISNQAVQNGKVIVDEVDSPTPAWIAIHVMAVNGVPGPDIGFARVKAGKNMNISVTVDQTQVTQTLFAMLHTDNPEIGTYNPKIDTAEVSNGQMVGMAFGSDGKTPAANTDMTMKDMNGQATGAATVMPGMGEATPTTAATGMGIMNAPTATAAPSPTPTMGMAMATPAPDINPLVKVSDQALNNGMVKLDEVVSGGPGWVVIYTTNESGQPDQAIGHAAVQVGDNKNVMVPVDPAKAQGKLYAQLHVDAGQVGTFEFPGADAPLMIGVHMIAGTFSVTAPQAAAPTNTPMTMGDGMKSTGLPFIKPADQPIVNGTIIIPEVFSAGDSWLVIHRQNGDGTQGPMVGFVRVKDGDNTNVVVRVDTRFTSTTMYAMLHADKGKIGKLEFPGPDEPVMANGAMVNVPFIITGNRDADVIINLSKDTAGVQHLVDGYDMTLYASLKDRPGQSNCSGDCLDNFKPLVASGRIVAGSGVASNKLGFITLQGGIRQVTYSGAPLYTYTEDSKPGDMNAQGLDGLWFVVTP